MTHTHTFSNTLLFTATYGFQRGFDNQQGVSGNASAAQQGLASLGFPSYLNHGFGTLPTIIINGYASANQSGNNTNIGTNPFSILREGQIVHHLDGTVSWVHKKHELKFGGEWRLHQINFTQPGWPSGAFNFDFSGSSQVSSDPSSGGDGLASFLMGVGPPSAGGGGCTPCQVGFVNFVSTESFQYATFVQDNYRVTPKLTLNLGLRYELNTPRTERYNRMNSLDPTAVSPLQLTAAKFPRLSRSDCRRKRSRLSAIYTASKSLPAPPIALITIPTTKISNLALVSLIKPGADLYSVVATASISRPRVAPLPEPALGASRVSMYNRRGLQL